MPWKELKTILYCILIYVYANSKDNVHYGETLWALLLSRPRRSRDGLAPF